MVRRFLLIFLGALLFLSFSYAQPASLPATNSEMDNLENAVIKVAEGVGKAVVFISAEFSPPRQKGAYLKSPQTPFAEDEFFRRFFEDFFGEMPLPDLPSRRVGIGSGVIIDQKGYILTNEHVVADAQKVTVKLYDGREFKAQVQGKDPRSDLAVIKIDAQNLPVAQLGDSDELRIGQWVVAMGNPFGFVLDNPEPTVTAGVISALHRSLGRISSSSRDYTDLIQTDAAINPGNSGGPLVDLKGRVIGINVAIFSTSGGYEGIGFAIPINNAKRIISRLIEGKTISYGWLGVTVQDLDENLAKYFGLSQNNGVLVAKVLEKSPAQKAGIKEGDVIIKFDNKAIANVKKLLKTVGETEPGKKAKIVVLRDKRELALDIQVGERPQDIEEWEETGTTEQEPRAWRGIEVRPLTSRFSSRLGTKEQEGVIIADVHPDSPADKAGLTPGDVILEINKTAIKNLDDYQKAIRGVKGDCLVKTKRGYVVLKSE